MVWWCCDPVTFVDLCCSQPVVVNSFEVDELSWFDIVDQVAVELLLASEVDDRFALVDGVTVSFLNTICSVQWFAHTEEVSHGPLLRLKTVPDLFFFQKLYSPAAPTTGLVGVLYILSRKRAPVFFGKRVIFFLS